MVDLSTLTPEDRKVIESRREYQRKWREANKDKIKQHNKRFYEKMAAKKENASR